MTEFDITFELFTLLLGLAMAEVLAGYVRVFKLRSRTRRARVVAEQEGLAPEDWPAPVRIGWLIPLSATVVICHQATFWLFMYEMQDSVPLNFLSLLIVLALIGWYYLISAALWPEEPEAWPDFNAYYMDHRVFIWGGVLAIAILGEQGYLAYADPAPVVAPEWMTDLYAVVNVIGSFALLAMPFLRSVRWATAVLVVIVIHFAVCAALSPWIPV